LGIFLLAAIFIMLLKMLWENNKIAIKEIKKKRSNLKEVKK